MLARHVFCVLEGPDISAWKVYMRKMNLVGRHQVCTCKQGIKCVGAGNCAAGSCVREPDTTSPK